MTIILCLAIPPARGANKPKSRRVGDALKPSFAAAYPRTGRGPSARRLGGRKSLRDQQLGASARPQQATWKLAGPLRCYANASLCNGALSNSRRVENPTPGFSSPGASSGLSAPPAAGRRGNEPIAKTDVRGGRMTQKVEQCEPLEAPGFIHGEHSPIPRPQRASTPAIAD